MLGACVVPINSTYESARMLKRGNFEAAGHYTRYIYSEDGESEAVNSNFGLRFGYGITDRVDLKARYIRLAPEEEGSEGVNYAEMAAKFQLAERWAAASLPVGLYFASEETEVVISPKFLFTYPANDQFEATFAAKADIFPEDEADLYLGFNLGLGISSNLDKWAIRPEVGVMVDPGESGASWAWGIGFSAILPGRSSK